MKNINVFYSTFTNVFYFCHVFLRFLTLFFFLERFFYTSMVRSIPAPLELTTPLARAGKKTRFLKKEKKGFFRFLVFETFLGFNLQKAGHKLTTYKHNEK